MRHTNFQRIWKVFIFPLLSHNNLSEISYDWAEKTFFFLLNRIVYIYACNWHPHKGMHRVDTQVGGQKIMGKNA